METHNHRLGSRGCVIGEVAAHARLHQRVDAEHREELRKRKEEMRRREEDRWERLRVRDFRSPVGRVAQHSRLLSLTVGKTSRLLFQVVQVRRTPHRPPNLPCRVCAAVTWSLIGPPAPSCHTLTEMAPPGSLALS